MCLPVPTVENLDELNQRSEFGLAPIRERYFVTILFRRFAPKYGGAPPRTPPSFRLRVFRFAER
jgi:hypothetical protein